MSSFLTQCPHCLTPFRVTDTQLEAADGLVRCGACLGIFSAAANRITLKQSPEAAGADFDEPGFDEDEFEDAAAGQAPGATPPELKFATTQQYAPAEPDAEDAEPVAEYLEAGEEDPADTAMQDAVQSAVESRQAAAYESAGADSAYADANLLDTDPGERDFDIPLGDLDLDAETELAEDADDFSTDADSDYEDSDEDFAEELDEESDEEFDEEFDEEEGAAEADAEPAAAELYEEYTDDSYAEVAEPAPHRAPYERSSTDKTELRRYLAGIADDEALGPLDDDALDTFTDEPVTLLAAPRRGRLYTFALFSLNLLLVGVLAAQYTHANLATLSRNPRLTPVMAHVCRVMTCPEPLRSQLASLVSEQLLVRSHPRFAQALEVSFIFRNDARDAQPFPAIELGFSDTNNQPLANRLFQPAEYLPPELQNSAMPAQSSLQIILEMADPGSQAVNYTLAFREP